MFAYLIDQQMSAQMSIELDTTKYQGIKIVEQIPMIKHSKVKLKLSREQAIALVKDLESAIDYMPDHGDRVEYPGKVVP